MIHIHIGPADADLLMLYKYLPAGLSKVFKQVLIAYYKGDEFKIPQLKYKQKNKIVEVKIYINKEEEEILKPLLSLKNKSSIIKNLVRMYFAKTLADICRPVYSAKAVKENTQYKKPLEKEPIKKEIEEKTKPIKEAIVEKPVYEEKKEAIEKITKKEYDEKPRKMPDLFMPKEY